MCLKILIVLHNGSTYDYHFVIKELAEEFKKELTCLEENTEKYITFTVPIEKEVAIKGEQEWKTNYNKYVLYITVY